MIKNKVLGNRKVVLTKKILVTNLLTGVILLVFSFAAQAILTGPLLYELKPVNGSYVKTRNPIISVKTSGNVDISSIKLVVDGSTVSHSYDTATGTITYTPIIPLPEKSIYVYVSAVSVDGTRSSLSSRFTVDVTAPVFSNFMPLTWTTSKPFISLKANDNVKIKKESLIFKINGKIYPAYIRYDGYWYIDEAAESHYWVETDAAVAFIEYYATNLPDGLNTVEITITDEAGNAATSKWTINIQQPPVIKNIMPLAESRLKTLSPVISLNAYDNGSIDRTRIYFSIDGIRITPQFNAATGLISYLPQNLGNEDYHQVNVTVYDTAGSSRSVSWRFYTYTWTTEMPVPTDSNKCASCHAGFPNIHPVSSCSGCHNTYVPDCMNCHLSSGVSWPEMGNHGGSYVTNGFRIYHSNSVIYCNTCHNANKYSETVIPRHNDPFTVATRHKSPTAGCDKCHATTLTREHVMRKDSGGNALTCETCHLSNDISVKSAITNKDARCNACHPANAQDYHHSQTDSTVSCITCHQT